MPSKSRHRPLRRLGQPSHSRPCSPRHTPAVRRKTRPVAGLDSTEINSAIVQYASQGKCVARLKGGDPAIFARTAEELDRWWKRAFPFEVVPGITAAMAAASYAGIPITHRDWASSVAFITGQSQAIDGGGEAEESMDWRALAQFPGTLVFYMESPRRCLEPTLDRCWQVAYYSCGLGPPMLVTQPRDHSLYAWRAFAEDCRTPQLSPSGDHHCWNCCEFGTDLRLVYATTAIWQNRFDHSA